MFKKFISIISATILLAVGVSVLSTTAANAADITDATATSTSAIGSTGTNAAPITVTATLVTVGGAETFFVYLPTGWSYVTNPSGNCLTGGVVTSLTPGMCQAYNWTPQPVVISTKSTNFTTNVSISVVFSANSLNVNSGRDFNVRFRDDSVGSNIDIGVATLAVGSSAPVEVVATTPTLTTAQIAAAAEAVAKAAAEAAAVIRAAEVAVAQSKLATVLKGDKAGTQDEYRSANINVTTAAALARVNAEVLKLSAADRADFAKIKAIAEKIEFDETFFNSIVRPEMATYAAFGVTGVTERTLSTVNAKILELPAAKRLDVKAMQEIVKAEGFIDRVANPATRGSVSVSTLVDKGLLAGDYGRKFSIVRGLGGYAEGSLNTIAKIEAAIKEQIAKADAPRARLEAIKAKIAARNK